MPILLPALFCDRMKRLLKDDYDNFINEIQNGSQSKGLFLNHGVEFSDIEQYNVKATTFYDNGFYFDYDSIGNTPIHHAGGIYIQDPSAMATIAALGERKFKNILDNLIYLGLQDTFKKELKI